MEFLKSNFLNTTTQLSLSTGSLTSSFLLNRDLRRQFVSDLDNNDLTTTTMTISFDVTTSVSRLAIMQTNVKAMNIFYNGSTANTFSITTTGSTIASQWTSNSETSMYMRFASVDVTSVTLDLKTTQVANSEKAIGWIFISTPYFVLDRVPSAKNYKPIISSNEQVHKLSDGGLRIHTTGEKFNGSIKYANITKSFRDSLKTVYDIKDSFGFEAFGTMTGWTDQVLYEVVWPGNFDFFKFSDNAVSSGFSGSIKLQERPY